MSAGESALAAGPLSGTELDTVSFAMKYRGILTLALAAVFAAGLFTGCSAPGSKEAQVASWRRQVKRNPDARVSGKYRGYRDWRRTDAQEAMTGVVAVAGGAAMLAGQSANMGRIEYK